MKYNYLLNLTKSLTQSALAIVALTTVLNPDLSNAFPIFAQQAYENPREATGRIVCHIVKGGYMYARWLLSQNIVEN